jgi:hypothetical protein
MGRGVVGGDGLIMPAGNDGLAIGRYDDRPHGHFTFGRSYFGFGESEAHEVLVCAI